MIEWILRPKLKFGKLLNERFLHKSVIILLRYIHNINKKKRYNPDIYCAVFNCAFEHYTIVKQAYLRGLNNILVFEYDIRFISNVCAAKKVFIKIDYIGCSVSILSCISLSVLIFNLLCDGQYQIKCQYILYLHVRNLKLFPC